MRPIPPTDARCAPPRTASYFRLASLLLLASAWSAFGSSACGIHLDRRQAGRGSVDDAGRCAPCTTQGDCRSAEVCAQLADDAYCAPTCTLGARPACAGDRGCAAAVSVDGRPLMLCLPADGGCGPPGPYRTGGARASAGGDAGAPLAPIAGYVGPSGGRVSRLRFAVVGDTRPASPDDTAGYPSAVIGAIYGSIDALEPRPLFAIATGDYVFATPGHGQAGPQLDLYLQAARTFGGVLFPAMGNHECTGATASNCGPDGADGMTENFTAFVDKLLLPLGRATPYGAVDVDALDGTWTAKFVFVAANAWSDAQAAWLDAALARPTTYTFVVRHEPATVTRAPGVPPSEEILAAHPLTLAIVGHSHTFARSGPREVIVGNGGAPLTSSSARFGFALVQQRSDGAIQVDALDLETQRVDPGLGFAVHADGSDAP